MNKKITIAVVGSGFAAHLHMVNYKRVSGLELVFKTLVSKEPAEQVEGFAKEFGFLNWTDDYAAMLNDPEIDVVDIITPPVLHADMTIDALKAGKHVIVEKPLTGYFGAPTDGALMCEEVEKELARIEAAVKESGKTFMYAENWVYASGIQKRAELLKAQRGKILYMHAEESHSGSHAYHAANWKYNGGGSLMRQGCHPITAVLYLKQVEAEVRGETIGIKSVLGDTGVLTACLGEDELKHIDARPVDVEDIGETIITFTDGTKAHVVSADMLVGGMKNTVDLYLNNAVHRAKINPNDAYMAYHAEAEGLENVYFAEKLGVKTGWQFLGVEEDILRGYVGELQDFMECVAYGREPLSNFQLAADTARVIYAAYRSAMEGRRIDF